MEFREGGYRLHATVSPEGQNHWSKADFLSIAKEKLFTSKDGFGDENWAINPAVPQNVWENTFTPKDDKVQVNMLLTYHTFAALEKEIDIGFKEGMIIDFQQLDELLLNFKK